MGGWVQASLGFFINRPKIALHQFCYFGVVYQVLKVVRCYGLSVLSMSVMGFPKIIWMGVSSIYFYAGFFDSFLTLQKAPL